MNKYPLITFSIVISASLMRLLGMGSLGRGVNARRAQQGLQQPNTPVRDVQETRILKLRLDELRYVCIYMSMNVFTCIVT
jgi:hypothetical protein